MEMLTCSFHGASYIIRYCSTKLFTWDLHGASYIIRYCTMELLTCNLHCGNYIMRHYGAALKIFFEKKKYKFSIPFYTRFQTCPPFQWCGGEILAKWDDSYRESGHSLPIHFKQIWLTFPLSRNFDFWKWNKLTNKTLTTEQPFTHSHCDCTAETWF